MAYLTRRRLSACLILVFVAAGTVTAQSIPVLPQLEGLGGPKSANDPIAVSATFQATPDGGRGVLSVTAKLAPGWHIYSSTQAPGGPMRTQFRVAIPGSVGRLAGPFVPREPPVVHRVEYFDVPVEEHHGEVTWVAPIEFAPGVDVGTVSIEGELVGQVCDEAGSCIPLSVLDTRFTAKYTGIIDPTSVPVASASTDEATLEGEPAGRPADAGTIPPVEQIDPSVATLFAEGSLRLPGRDGFRNGSVHARLSGELQPAIVHLGDTVRIRLTLQPDPGWHVYAYAANDPRKISKPTLIALVEPTGWQVGPVEASSPPVVHETGLSIEPEQRYHAGTVSWTVSLTVPAATPPGDYRVRGMIGYQTCSDSSCDRPVAAVFEATVRVDPRESTRPIPLSFAAGPYQKVAQWTEAWQKHVSGIPAAAGPTGPAGVVGSSAPAARSTGTGWLDLSRLEPVEPKNHSLAYVLVLAFVGGFILNFMPCVLPVIGLKVMAFVQQAGQHRRRVLTLNLSYCLGLLSIFWVLATLAAAASLGLSDKSLGWGEQYNYDGFTIPLLAIVFAMGLSFLGVWEIPLPGFVGTGRANELASKEGLAGAFFKGVITTILATPCSGPGLATALTWSATQPPSMVYLVFTFMGLGMSFPYLLIGAFPSLIRFIPKPGPWMETFKQLMGFVLLGTVVYLFTLIDVGHFIPTLALIFALWAGLWWVGRKTMAAPWRAHLRAWTEAAVLVGLVAWFGFAYVSDPSNHVPWQPFSLATLEKRLGEGETVLVDFTADW